MVGPRGIEPLARLTLIARYLGEVVNLLSTDFGSIHPEFGPASVVPTISNTVKLIFASLNGITRDHQVGIMLIDRITVRLSKIPLNKHFIFKVLG